MPFLVRVMGAREIKECGPSPIFRIMVNACLSQITGLGVQFNVEVTYRSEMQNSRRRLRELAPVKFSFLSLLPGNSPEI